MKEDANRPAFRYVVLFVSTYLILTSNGGLFLLVVALKDIAAEFDWPRSVPSLAFSLQFIGTGIGGILMGYWFDRRGAAPVVLLGSTMIGGGAIAASLITSEWQLFAIYGVMMGLFGQATMFGPLMINVMRWFEHRKGFAVGVVAAGQSIAGALWPPIFRHFNEAAGWQQTFFWFGVFAAVTSIPLTFLLRRRPTVAASVREPVERDRQAARAPGRDSDRDGRSWAELGLPPWALQAILCVAIVGCCVAMSMPLAHLVAHASDLGHATARAAEMLSVALGATLIVRLLAGSLLLDRFGGLVSLLVFSTVQALALTCYALADGLLALYLVSILFGLGYGGIGLCYPIIVREYLPESQAGRRLGLINLFGALGMALGGWGAGLAFDIWADYSPAFMIGVVFNLFNVSVILVLITRKRPPRLALAPV